MQQYPDQFVMTLAESVYEMPTTLVGYAMTSMNGGRIPRIVMSQGYAITSDMIMDVYEIKDKTGTVDSVCMIHGMIAIRGGGNPPPRH